MYDGVIMSRHLDTRHRDAGTGSFEHGNAPKQGCCQPVRRSASKGARYVADLTGGGRAELTLDPRLQNQHRRVAAHVPDRRSRGAVVVSIPDGRVLAMVGQSAADPRLGRRGARAAPLGARRVGVQGGLRGGAGRERRLGKNPHLLPRRRLRRSSPTTCSTCPSLDRRCDTLAFGLGKSQNAIIAKLATRHLTSREPGPRRAQLRLRARRSPSSCRSNRRTWTSPSDSLEFARTAAGFWHSTLSPMHGALLAATIANRGPDARRDADRPRRRARRAAGRAADRQPPPGLSRRGGRRGRSHDGADHPHRDRQGDVSRPVGAGACCPSRSPARPAPCPARPTGGCSATAGSSATRPQSAPPSRSPSPWATGPLAHQSHLRRPPHRQRAPGRPPAPTETASSRRSS